MKNLAASKITSEYLKSDLKGWLGERARAALLDFAISLLILILLFMTIFLASVNASKV